MKALTEAEIAIFLAAVPDDGQLLFLFLLETGLRIGEALGTEWRDVDFGKKVLRVRRQWSRKKLSILKSRNAKRTVRLTDSMTRMLWQQRAASSHRGDRQPIFGDRDGLWLDYDKAKRRWLFPARKATGLDWVGFHSFRHTCASRMFRHGVNVKLVSVWLGHASPGFTLQTYVHLFPEDTPDVSFVERLNAALPNLLCAGETAPDGLKTPGESVA